MVHRGDLDVIAICAGVLLGLLITAFLFFRIRWHKRRSHLPRSVNEQSVVIHSIRMNGCDTSTDFSASLSNSVAVTISEYPQKNAQPTWWNHHSKDRFISASGIPRYSYKDIQRDTQNFTTILGQGSFGPVYKAMMPTGGVAVVKMLAFNSHQGERESSKRSSRKSGSISS